MNKWSAHLTHMPRQLALDLPHEDNRSREDFLEGDSNEDALAMIEAWPDWPGPFLALIGPEGAGKSHLAAIWAEQAGARVISARALVAEAVPSALATGALVLEDAHEEAQEEAQERAFFHLLNLARQEGASILITARTPLNTKLVTLPDLASRLRAIPSVPLGQPDEPLLRAVLVKLFTDRQIAVDEALIAYLITRLERSFAAMLEAVKTLDRAALQRKRPVNRALAVEINFEP